MNASILARDLRAVCAASALTLLAAPGLLAATFHPELADDPLLHRHFLSAALWSAPRGAVLTHSPA